jgi:branched-subunit amino acid transport protein
MSDITLVIIGCAAVTFVIKAAGPVLLGGRQLPRPVRGVLALLAPALLAALVVVSALADGDQLTVGEDTAGVAVAGLVFWRTGSIVGCVVVSAVVTALLRAV